MKTLLPAAFLGAWQRDGLEVDGTPVSDAGQAVWIEAGAAYVDVRGPGGFASNTCFAGTTAWDDPCLRWRHEIDADDGGEGVDIGRMSFAGADLIEEGEFIAGRALPYRERWRRLSGSDGPVLAAGSLDGNALAVRVGDHAAVVVDGRSAGGGLSAAYVQWTGRRWVTQISLGQSAGDLPEPLDRDVPLPAGWEWRAT